MIHDSSAASSRANSNASAVSNLEAITNANTIANAMTNTRPKPTQTASTTSLTSNIDHTTRSPLFSTPDPNDEHDPGEELHLSECYTMETPS